jgi:hypothetical protein
MTGKRWHRAGVVLSAIAVAVFVSPGVGSEQRNEAGAAESPPNSIQVAVNGVLRKTWRADELMGGRFDWANPKGKFRPAVPLTYVLTFSEAGFAPASITTLTVSGKKERIALTGEALVFLKDLLLLVDIDKGGAWKLGVRTEAAERKLKALLPGRSFTVEAVRRIEISTGADATKKKQ